MLYSGTVIDSGLITSSWGMAKEQNYRKREVRVEIAITHHFLPHGSEGQVIQQKHKTENI